MLRDTISPRGRWGRRLVIGLALAAIAGAGDAQPGKTTDKSGDPLPSGALARMGTLRLRHGDVITFVAFPDAGKTVLTASQDNTLRIWDRETGKELRRFEGPANPLPPGVLARPGIINTPGLSRVALTQDGKTAAILVANNAIQLWDVETGKNQRQLKAPPSGASAITYSPNGKLLAVRGGDRTVYLLDAADGKDLVPVRQNQKPGAVRFGIAGGDMSGLAFSHDGKQLAIAELEFDQKVISYVRVVDVETRKEVRRVDTAAGGGSALAYSPDGNMLAIGNDTSIQLRDANTGNEIRSLTNQAQAIHIVISPDSKIVAAKGRDGVVRVFDAGSGKRLHELGEPTTAAWGAINPGFNAYTGNAGDFRDLAFSRDGKLIAVGGAQTLRVWNVQTGKEQPLAGGHRGAVTALVVTPDGKTMFTRGADNVVRRWNAHTGEELGQFSEPRGTTGVVFSPDGKLIALANTDGVTRLVAADTGNELFKLKGHAGGAAAIAFSPDSKTLATRGNDNAIRLFDAIKGAELRQITLPGANNPGGGVVVARGFGSAATNLGLAFSPDGQSIAANINASAVVMRGQPQPETVAGTIRIFDVETAKEVRRFTVPVQRIISNIAYSPDGRLIAAENSDQTISLWELASGRERAVLGEPVQPTTPVRFAGGGGFAMSARATIQSITMAFSPDGGMLAARGPGNSGRVWDVDHAKEIGPLKGHDGAVVALSFAPDGNTILTGSSDTTALVWDVGALKRDPRPNPIVLENAELTTLWTNLGTEDAGKAIALIQRLRSGPKHATAFLSEHLKPAPPPDVAKVDQWLADLNSGTFAKRNKANEELERLGELAIPAIKKVLASEPSLETRRRMETLLEKLTSGTLSAEQIRIVRAIEALEKMADADARRLLTTLAGGAQGALTTRHAQAALTRLAK